MTLTYLKYPLAGGYIHNWLVAGPLAIPTTDLNPETTDNQALSTIQRHYDPNSGVTQSPVDLAPLGPVSQEHPQIAWRYYRCRDDHYIDFSSFYPICTYLRAWAYAQVMVPSIQKVVLCLTTNAPADIWLNGQHLYRSNHFSKQNPLTVSLPASLQSGSNDLLVRFENAAIRASAYVAAVQILQLPEGAEIALPTEIEEKLMDERTKIEKVMEGAYLDRYIYGNLDGDRFNKNESISLRFLDNLDTSGEVTMRLQSLGGDIFQEEIKPSGPSSAVELAHIFPLRNGPHHLALFPSAELYFIKKVRVERKDLFHIVRTPYSLKASPDLRKRKKEAMADAAERRNDSLFCEIARMSLGKWENIEQKNIIAAQNRIVQDWGGSASDLLGFVGMLLRFRRKRAFRDYIQRFKLALETCITDYHYWEDDSNCGQMENSDILFPAESLQILRFTCEILAGQLLPDCTFKVSGKTGLWHKTHGESLAIAWLQQRGRFGFTAWDSPAGIEYILAALSHLVDLSDSEQVCELASILMDKIFFSLAVNSFQGAYGSSHGWTDTASVLSSRLEATSGISRMMWGDGNFNEAVAGQVSLALCQNYELPEVIRKISQDIPGALWVREQHSQPQGTGSSQDGNSWKVNKVTYRTADYMLCSAQDYYPGQKGQREHIWQATLGLPDAIVYVNHPTCLSEDDAHQPNLWAGNGVLPRVAQWGDVLIAVHKLPQDDWLGFTHAYFPTAAFDEYRLEGNWAFARKGSAYLALNAACSFELLKHGPTAFRELRSSGLENIWICQMGHELLDGSFNDFQQKILDMQVAYEGLTVRCKSIRNDQLVFGWGGLLLVNGSEMPLSGFKHHESIYCVADLPAESMDIIHKDEGIRLKFN